MKVFTFLLIVSLHFPIFSQGLIRAEVSESLEGICDSDNVLAFFPSFKYNHSSIKKSKKSKLENELTSQLTSLTNKMDISEEGIINIILNCKGDVIKCEINLKVIDSELKIELENAFANLKIWKPAIYKGKLVDSSLLISFRIQNRKIILE